MLCKSPKKGKKHKTAETYGLHCHKNNHVPKIPSNDVPRVVFIDEDSERIRLAVIEWLGDDLEMRMAAKNITRLMTYKFRTALTQHIKDLAKGPPSTDSDD